MLGRRAFLKLLPASPFAGKAAAEKLAAEMARINTAGVNNNIHPLGGYPSETADPTTSDYARAFNNAGLLRQVETVLYEEERHVGFIDPDLAVLKSFSLNAKIAFQRQRNVRRRIEQMQSEYPWRKIVNLVRNGLPNWPFSAGAGTSAR